MSLARFIRDLHRKECEFKIEPEICQQLVAAVTSVVKDLIPTTVPLMPANKGRLSVLEVANAGSYFEQTKIIAPNEYDFMLVIRELSEPGAIEVSKGCREGHVKVTTTEPDKWCKTRFEETANRSFLRAVLEFNLYVRQAVELFNQGFEPVRTENGQLIFKNVLSRGKPYKQFSFVQTAYFEWKYNSLQSGSNIGIGENASTPYAANGKRNKQPPEEEADDEMVEVLYSRKQHVDAAEGKTKHRGEFTETLKLDVDLMACCHVPLEMLTDVLPKEALENPYLAKNGCHIVLKPCGNLKCFDEDTECRLISYTKSEQELMRNLPPNWKIVYKFLKWIFHFCEVLGVDSYKLKTAVLHLSQTAALSDDVNVDTCMLMLLRFLVRSGSKNHMPSYFNPMLNVWNVSPRFKHFVKWDMELLYRLIASIDETPLSEYNYDKFHRLLQVKIEQFCDVNNVADLLELESRINPSEFDMFCVQGSTFIDVVRGMEIELGDYKPFRWIAFRMKCHVLVDVMWEIGRWLVSKTWNGVKMLVYPQR